MWTLVAKLALTPAIVVATTLVGRRFGGAVSGWLVGLPLMSGPITLFFAVEQGKQFAARASVGSLSGTLAEAGFCLGWAQVARRAPWPVALAAGSASFAVVGLAAELLPLDPSLPVPLGPLALVSLLFLVAALRLLPRLKLELRDEVLPPRWELPARAIVATVLLLLLTGLATVLGARLSGLLTVYPLYTVVLAAFAHAHEGEAGAVQVLRGLLMGLYSFVCFYLVLALVLPAASVIASFAVALAAALGVQGSSLLALRRECAREDSNLRPTA